MSEVRAADTSRLEACIVCAFKRSLREGAKVVCNKSNGVFHGHPDYEHANGYLDVCDDFQREKKV